jgi:subfamily B ATP-binding cassette protein MsbA
MRGKTCVVIAHRLSTIQHADHIIVLSHGKLVEAGNHQELLSLNGMYASLCRLQFNETSAVSA